ncbi:MAG: tetratricopeptide repeat protein [Myxococcota bacterium]
MTASPTVSAPVAKAKGSASPTNTAPLGTRAPQPPPQRPPASSRSAPEPPAKSAKASAERRDTQDKPTVALHPKVTPAEPARSRPLRKARERLESQPPPPKEPETPDRIQDAKELVRRCQKELALHKGDAAAGRTARLHYEIGRIYEGVLHDPRAADQYEKAAALAPDQPKILRAAQRTLSEIGRGDKALTYFDQEVRVTKDPERRASILYAKGQLQRKLGQGKGALESFRSARELAPNDHSILQALRREERIIEDWAGLDLSYQHTVAASEDPAYRAAITARRAVVAELRTNDSKTAAELYGAALGADPRVSVALPAQKRLRHRQHGWKELVGALELEAQRAPTVALRSEVRRRMALVYRDKLADLDRAAATLREALSEVPEDRALRRELAECERLAGRPAQQALELQALSESAPTPLEGALLCHRLGQLYEEKLDDPTAARECYARAAKLRPTFRPALRALRRAYETLGEHQALIELLTREAEASTDPLRKSRIHAEVADLYEHQLSDADAAVRHHHQALTLNPRHEASFKALVRLHAAAGRYQDVVELMRRAVDQNPGKERTIAYLFRVGLLQEDHLDDPAGAVLSYRKILDIDPANLSAIQAVVRAAERAGDYPALLDGLLKEAKETSDGKHRNALLYRAAEVSADHLDDADGALARLHKVLEAQSGHRPALSLLSRIYTKSGRWDDLLANTRRILDVTEEPEERLGLLFQMGELSETHLGKPDDAAAYYRSALEIDPSHEQSFEALRSLFTRRQAWADLARLLEGRSADRESALTRARRSEELGALYEDRIGRDEQALRFYEQALGAMPNYRPALDGRTRLLEKKKLWAELAKALNAEAEAVDSLEETIDALLREAEIYAARLGQSGKAADALERARVIDPNHLGTLLALEDLHLSGTGSEDALVTVYRSMSEATADPKVKVAALRELARLTAVEDEDGAEPVYRALLGLAPHDTEALEFLAGRAASDELLRLEARLAATFDEPGLVAAHQFRVAEQMEDADPEQALGAYRAALALDPESLSGVRGFTRVAMKLGGADALREAAKREASTTKDVSLAGTLLVRSALERAADDSDGAVADLSHALELQPADTTVAQHLTRLMRERGENERLVELLGRAADATSALDRRAELHVEIAETQVETLNNLPAAIASLERALKAMPDHVPALSLYAACLELAERWPDAVSTLGTLIRHASDPEVLADANLTLAVIAEDHLKDSKQARDALEEVIKHEPENKEAVARLGRIYAAEGRSADAARLGKQLVAAATGPEERASALVQVAAIEQARGRPGEAEKSLDEAISIVGPTGEAGAAYQRLIEDGEVGSFDDYAGAILRYLEAARRSGADRTGAYLELTRVYRDRLDRRDKALSTLKQATGELPAEPALAEALCRHHLTAGAFEEALGEGRRLLGLGIVPEMFRLIGEAHRGGGDEGEALAALLAVPLTGGAPSAEEAVAIRGRNPRTAEARPGLLGDAGFREIHVDGCHDSPAARLVAALSDASRKIYPGEVTSFGVSKRDKISARSEHPLRGTAEHIANVFGVQNFDLYVHDAEASDVSAELFSTPAIMIPSWAADIGNAGLTFLLARVFAHLSREMAVFAKVGPGEVPMLVAAAGRAVSPGFGVGAGPEEELDAMAGQVVKGTPRRARRALEELSTHYVATPVPNLVGWASAVEQTALRAALLVTDDLEAALTMVERTREEGVGSATADDLVRFWVSDTAVRFRRAIG